MSSESVSSSDSKANLTVPQGGVAQQPASDKKHDHHFLADLKSTIKSTIKNWHIEDTPYVQAMHPEELKSKELWIASGAELLGVAFFIFIFQRIFRESFLLWGGWGPGCFLTILIFAFMFILPLFYVFGSLSGAHLNPAITWAVFATRRISFIRAAIYTIAQLIGSAIGAAIAMGTIHPNLRDDYSLATCSIDAGGFVNDGDDFIGGSILLELFQTFIVVFIAFGLAFDPRGWGKSAPYGIIAFYIVLIYCGGCMNPAVAFGPSLINADFGQKGLDNNYQHLWVFMIVPVIGGVCAGLFYEKVYMFRDDHVAPVPSQVGNAHEHHENLSVTKLKAEKIQSDLAYLGL